LLHCDLIDAAETARFSVPFVPLGLCPEAASSLLLPQLLGWTRAASLLMLGEPLDAQTALAQGLINRVVPAAELLSQARARAARLASLPAASLRETKRLMKLGLAEQVQSRMAVEFQAFGERLQSPEAQEAFAAFMARRAPDFSRFD
jgi:enoyl-CoA hydratase/carnithine racemase